jgi:hypothetical protein
VKPVLSPEGQRGVGLAYSSSNLSVLPLCSEYGWFDGFVTLWPRSIVYSQRDIG